MLPEDMSVFTNDKILELDKVVEVSDTLKKERKTIGLCHGGFDLVHPGHIKHLESAKNKCDILIVSITCDKYVTSRKGEGRPILPDQLRAYGVASLSFVDLVVICPYERATELLEQVKPSVYIKGPDFIGKRTPGIEEEKKVMKSLGGQLVCTDDPKLSTTEIINHICRHAKPKKLLIGIDRDGTLIEDPGYLGKEENWKNQVVLKSEVIHFLHYLKTKYQTTMVVISNQSGVARGYFTVQVVEEINRYLAELLEKEGIAIQNWHYCPDIDKAYAASNPDDEFVKDFVKEKTKRKPSTEMFDDALNQLGKSREDFDSILMLGDKEGDDKEFAQNLGVDFINVKGKSFDQLKQEYDP